tara:strand:+ start:6700 stop:8808 length:2109 start_codon:yes stop_codon:yes gene_type:complete
MATYWLDPFLEATTQGNGTTDTSTQDGSYAAPFSLLNFRETGSSTLTTTINGTTLSDGDEVRFKGLPFATLFESKGNVYHSGGAYNDIDGHLQPITGNSSFDATISTTKSSLFAFQNSDISTYLPGWAHPLWIAAYYTSDSSNLYTLLSPFLWPVLDETLGYNTASSTGMELFRLKDTYANPIDLGSDYYYWFATTNKVKLTAGWTSTTAQDGYSIFEAHNSSNYRYLNIARTNNCKTQFDLERCVICHASRQNAGNYNEIYFDGYRILRGEQTDHVFFSCASSNDRGFLVYSADDYTTVGAGNNTTTYPCFFGSGRQRYNHATFHHQTTSKTYVETVKNLIIQPKLQTTALRDTVTLNIGNFYGTSSDDNDGKNRVLYSNLVEAGATITYLQDSIYFLTRDASSGGPIALQTDPLELQNEVYQSGLIKPGIAPLASLTATTSATSEYGPNDAGSIVDAAYLGLTREVSTNNTWFTPTLAREGLLPIRYGSLEKLTCNSNNYKTTAHNIALNTATALGATDAPQYMIWSAEHNDYDGNPLSLIGDPYTAGNSYGVLLYNDVANSQSALVAQWSGTTGGASSNAYIPLDLPVPSYNAGSDNLRVTVSAAYSNGGSGGQEKIRLQAHHRDSTQTNKFRFYDSSADTTISSSDASSPTTATLNLTNVPTSGQDNITNVIVGIKLQFASNTNIQKFYITNAAIETY